MSSRLDQALTSIYATNLLNLGLGISGTEDIIEGKLLVTIQVNDGDRILYQGTDGTRFEGFSWGFCHGVYFQKRQQKSEVKA